MSDVPLSTLFGLLAVLIILSAFFSSSETGLVALNRYRLRHDAQAGHRGAKRAGQLLASPDRMFGLILLGNNLVNIMAASIATLIALRLLGESGVWVSTVVLTAVVLIFAELLPKTLAAMHPQVIAYPASRVLVPLLKVVYPAVWLINLVVSLFLRPFGVKSPAIQSEALSREELRVVLQESGRQISDNHQQMLLNILDLEHGSIDDVMVPRGDIVGIDLADDWPTIIERLSQTVHTRLPVWDGDLDNIQGLLHVRSILPRLSQGQLDRPALLQATRTPYYIPEGTTLTQQLLEFQTRERRLGLVVDEYGDIQGLVTLDDILEEIVGEYTTEGILPKRKIRRQEDGSYLVDAGATVRMLNRHLDTELPSSEASTLNGLILEHLESLPEGTTCLWLGNHQITILDLDDKRIKKVQLKHVLGE
jgi:Mg2+/Co2+ transporter CorB